MVALLKFLFQEHVNTLVTLSFNLYFSYVVKVSVDFWFKRVDQISLMP